MRAKRRKSEAKTEDQELKRARHVVENGFTLSAVENPGYRPYTQEEVEVRRDEAQRGLRPALYTPEEVEEALRLNFGVVSDTAFYLGVRGPTVSAYLKKWPQLGEVQQELKEALLDEAEKALWHLALVNRDPSSLRFFLRTQGKGRGYGDQRKLDVEGTLQANVQQTDQRAEAQRLTLGGEDLRTALVALQELGVLDSLLRGGGGQGAVLDVTPEPPLLDDPGVGGD